MSESPLSRYGVIGREVVEKVRLPVLPGRGGELPFAAACSWRDFNIESEVLLGTSPWSLLCFLSSLGRVPPEMEGSILLVCDNGAVWARSIGSDCEKTTERFMTRYEAATTAS